jgi:hypothetical protein
MDEQEVLRRFVAELLDERRYIVASRAADEIVDQSGIYAIHALDGECIPSPFCQYLTARNHRCLYVGKAVKGLRRLVRYDLNGKGPSTFFCSLGVMLGYRPVPGSLVGKKDQNNFTFSTDDSRRLASWSSAHLAVAWRGLDKLSVDALEVPLIEFIKPLLNVAHNPAKLRELERLRRDARTTARGLPIDHQTHDA